MKVPAIITKLQKEQVEVEDLTNSQLDVAVAWAIGNDPELSSLLDDEVDFRLNKDGF